MVALGRFVVGATRALILLAVFASLIAGAAMVVMGFVGVLKGGWHILEDREINVEVMRALSVEVIETADVLLLGVVMFVIALGLFQLFIDADIDVPAWSRVASLGDLKEHLIAVTVVLLGISFLGRVVHWDGEREIVYYGVAIAAVLVPLVAMFAVLGMINKEEDAALRGEESARSD